MATAKQIRSRILDIAARTQKDEPTDVDARARGFIARLAGSMSAQGELEVERALSELIGIDMPRAAADGA